MLKINIINKKIDLIMMSSAMVLSIFTVLIRSAMALRFIICVILLINILCLVIKFIITFSNNKI